MASSQIKTLSEAVEHVEKRYVINGQRQEKQGYVNQAFIGDEFARLRDARSVMELVTALYEEENSRAVHPYGRSNVWECFVSGETQRREKVPNNNTKLMIWIVFIGLILGVVAAIIYLAETSKNSPGKRTFNKLWNKDQEKWYVWADDDPKSKPTALGYEILRDANNKFYLSKQKPTPQQLFPEDFGTIQTPFNNSLADELEFPNVTLTPT